MVCLFLFFTFFPSSLGLLFGLLDGGWRAGWVAGLGWMDRIKTGWGSLGDSIEGVAPRRVWLAGCGGLI